MSAGDQQCFTRVGLDIVTILNVKNIFLRRQSSSGFWVWVLKFFGGSNFNFAFPQHSEGVKKV